MPKTNSSTKAKAKAKPQAAHSSVQSPASNRAKTLLSKRLVADVTLGGLFSELVGTFTVAATALAIATLSGNSNPLFTGIVIMAAYLVFMRLSRSHVNPAVTLGLLSIRKISAIKAVGYIIAQVLGGMLAYVVVSQFVHTAPVDAAMGQSAPSLYHITMNSAEHWRPFWAEALGTLMVGLGVGAAFLNRKSEGETSFTVGVMYVVGVILGALASVGVLNPAVAIAVGAYDFANSSMIWWNLLQFAVGPILGAVAGMWLYKLLLWDVTTNGKEEAEKA